MTVLTGEAFIQRFETFAPPYLAMGNDPIGLAVGSAKQPVQRMLVTLDVRPETVEEAIEKKVDFIFAHHPPIFRPAKNLVTDDPQIQMYADLLKHDITVYSAHTNLDVAEGGMNDWLAEAIGLEQTEVLTPTYTEAYKKLAVFVPVTSEETVRRALHDAGAGEVGDYKDVSYTLEGLGRFTPQEGAHPSEGEVGKPESVEEVKIEMILPEHKVPHVVDALKEAHPYEEPVFDLYTIDHYQKQYGVGRIGNLSEPMPFQVFLEKVKQVFGVDGLRYIGGEEDRMIRRVAVLGGDGGKYYTDALKKGADAYITGDVYYHTAHDMQTAGLTVVDPGHHIESICKEPLTRLFTQWAKEEEWDVEILPSEVSTEPFRFFS